jgi:hypothetical protein
VCVGGGGERESLCFRLPRLRLRAADRRHHYFLSSVFRKTSKEVNLGDYSLVEGVDRVYALRRLYFLSSVFRKTSQEVNLRNYSKVEGGGESVLGCPSYDCVRLLEGTFIFSRVFWENVARSTFRKL